MDQTYPTEGDEHGPDRRWAMVLSDAYAEPGREMGWVRGAPAQMLDRFLHEPDLRDARCLDGGKAVDAVRVGDTRYVAVLPHSLPWPVGLMSPTAWFVLLGVLAAAGIVVWFVVRRPHHIHPPGERPNEAMVDSVGVMRRRDTGAGG
jgi:hypothetical protein